MEMTNRIRLIFAVAWVLVALVLFVIGEGTYGLVALVLATVWQASQENA